VAGPKNGANVAVGDGRRRRLTAGWRLAAVRTAAGLLAVRGGSRLGYRRRLAAWLSAAALAKLRQRLMPKAARTAARRSR